MHNIEFTKDHLIVVYAYLVPVFGLLMLLALIRNNHLFNKKQSQLFKFAVYINLILIAATSIDYLLVEQANEFAWIIRRITSTTHFVLAPLLPIALLNLFNRKKLHLATYIPFIINAVACIGSAFFRVVFFIDANNKYSRGPLFFLPLMVSVLYIMLLVTNPIINKRQGRRRELLYLLAIVGLQLIATVLEIMFHFKCLEYACSAIGLIMYYILQNIHYFASDPLTGAYNRQMYTHMLSNIQKMPRCILALVDLNDFKIINDTQGHDAGDKALVQFVATLTKHLENVAVIYRIGGDEFMLMAKRASKESFTTALQKALHQSEKENGLSFAYGMCEYFSGDSVEDVQQKVDRAMYQQKATMKVKTVEE